MSGGDTTSSQEPTEGVTGETEVPAEPYSGFYADMKVGMGSSGLSSDAY